MAFFQPSQEHEDMFGQIAVKFGYIRSLDLVEGMSRQVTDMSDYKIGEILVELGFLNLAQVEEILTFQEARIAIASR